MEPEFPDKVTESDINCIDYFITEKGDITRWCDWGKRKSVIAKQFPELIDALDRLSIANRTLEAVMHTIKDFDCDQ